MFYDEDSDILLWKDFLEQKSAKALMFRPRFLNFPLRVDQLVDLKMRGKTGNLALFSADFAKIRGFLKLAHQAGILNADTNLLIGALVRFPSH